MMERATVTREQLRDWITSEVRKHPGCESMTVVKHLPALLRRVGNQVVLLIDEADDEQESPTAAACDSCFRLLETVSSERVLADAHERPRVTTVGSGDLILEWAHSDRRVLLFVLADGSTRLQQLTGFGQEALVVEVARNASPHELFESLQWLA